MKDGEPPGGWIKRWAELGDLPEPLTESSTEDWHAVDRMIKAAKGLMAIDQRKLERLLATSKRNLGGLADPFEIDFGAHRWLSSDREEAYSDWLAWIVRHLPQASHVFELFQIPKPDYVKDHETPEVEREKVLPGNHRLDLLICYEKYRVVVEVKTNPPGTQDLEKHDHYLKWMNAESGRGKPSLLVIEPPRDSRRFKVVCWQDCCRTLGE